MEKSYKFFIDESMHDPKITLKNTLINRNDKYSSSYFTLAAVGSENKNMSELLNQYSILERKYKKLHHTNKEDEFKGKSIKSKNFVYGLNSMAEKFVMFFNELFTILNDYKAIIHLSTVSKFELLFHSIFSENYEDWAKIKDYKKTTHIILEILHNNLTEELLEVLFNPDSKPLDFHEQVGLINKKLKSNMNGSYYSELYAKVSDQIVLYLLLVAKRFSFQEYYDWNYIFSLNGLSKLLISLNADRYNTKIILDGIGKRTLPLYYSAILLFNDIKVGREDSKENIGLRLADMIANFFARIMRSIENDYNGNKYLDPIWFDLDEIRFNCYKNIGLYLQKMRDVKWTTYTGVYSHIPVRMFSLFEFFTYFRDYEDFRKIKSYDCSIKVEYIALLKERNMNK